MTADGAGTSGDVLLTAADVDRAVAEGVIGSSDATNLLAWARERATANPSAAHAPAHLPVEQMRGLNLVTVAYYCGALLIIGACAWFLGDKWDALGAQGVLATALIYAIVLASVGVLLLRAGFRVAGGLLITVAVCVTPIVVYAVEDLVGLWPGTNYGSTTMTYATHQYRLSSCYLVMELATIVVAAIALWFVRFGFLTAPLAVTFWFLSMDVVSLVSDLHMDLNARARITVAVGVLMMVIGVGLDRAQAKRLAARGHQGRGLWFLDELVRHAGLLGRADVDGQPFRSGAAGLPGDQRRPDSGGRQAGPRGDACAGHTGRAHLPVPPGLRRVSRHIPVPVRFGAVGLEPDSVHGVCAAVSASPGEKGQATA